MKEKEKGGWLPIVGLILLIAVLFAGVKLVFAGLGYVIPQDEGPEGTGTWYGRDDPGVREIRLGQEDVLEFSLRLMDSLGREMVYRETVLGDEDAPQESPPMPVIYDGRR